MTNISIGPIRDASIVTLSLLSWQLAEMPVEANPQGGSGAAVITTSGRTETVTTSSSFTTLNWNSFNINAGETTTFVEPSSTSVVWNNINGGSPSQILGNLNANGYLILDNQSGFYVGGQASITTHGLIMTTAGSAAPSLDSGGAWDFNAPPPTAQIINYGQINITGGGSVFLIANDIENYGSISAPAGKIGLYAGEQVLVSMSPDGRGLSAQVTLPQGSVDNEGRLIADGGTIAAQAQTVNQNGTIQANSVQDVNGTIELLASGSLNLGAGSVVSAQGDSVGISSGGDITLKSDNTFSDQTGSTISMAGGSQGGNGGQLEISAATLSAIQSQISGGAVSGFQGGNFTIDPTELNLTSAFVSSLTPILSSGLYQINLQADDTITLNTLWKLTDPGGAALLTLTAGNNIIFNTGDGIQAANNWSVDLSAGTEVAQGAKPVHISDGTQKDGIYLLGTAMLQTQNGDINCSAANEILVNSGAIRTLGGGNIDVAAQFGNINTGVGSSGYNYFAQAPYYTPFQVNKGSGVSTISTLGGISTAAGGNVTLDAGGNVTSFFENSSTSKAIATADPGAGAFGPQAGNVTINAGGSVIGHYVVANGVGSINAGQNIGNASQNVALSLVNGSWNLDAPNGNIYLQEVRNPNGIFDAPGGLSPANHFFDYNPEDSVNLIAGAGVFLTGGSLPRPSGAVAIIYPPSLNIVAGAGGVTLGADVILFPSIDQNLDITTLDGGALNGNNHTLSMSDSGQTQWISLNSFIPGDNGSTPLGLNNPNPVVINVAGDMENISLVTDKQTQITVAGNMISCNFSGQNLHPGDVTSIDVAGEILNPGSFSWIFLSQAIPALPFTDWTQTGVYDWQSILYAAVDPVKVAALTIAGNETPASILSDLNSAFVFKKGDVNTFFSYDPTTLRLTFTGAMTPAQETLLEQPLTVLKLDNNGNPLVINGKLQTDTITYNWIPPTAVASLFAVSQGSAGVNDGGTGYVVGGPGEFDIQAGSISLGNSVGILTEGAGVFNFNYNYLAPYTPSGATLNVTVDGNLEMPASTIAAIGGGNVNVTSLNGSMDLGSQDLLDSEVAIQTSHGLALGIYTTGTGDVNLTALGTINIDSSRVGAFNGGDVNIESLEGNVNAGSGGSTVFPIFTYAVDPQTGLVQSYRENIIANGIVAETLVDPSQTEGANVPGNITVTTPQGDILAKQGGILQEALNGNTSLSATINLVAGTHDSGTAGTADYFPGYLGNIDVGNSGVIGVNIHAAATGNIDGLFVSRGNSDISAAGNFSGTVLAGRSANVDAGGDIAGTVIGVGGVSASGGSVTASLVSQNVSVNGGTAQSTVGTSASASSTSQAAAQQATSDTQQQLANTGDGSDDDKKKKIQPLMQRVKRVTVILPKASAEKAGAPQG